MTNGRNLHSRRFRVTIDGDDPMLMSWAVFALANMYDKDLLEQVGALPVSGVIESGGGAFVEARIVRTR